jgi:putative membrane protein
MTLDFGRQAVKSLRSSPGRRQTEQAPPDRRWPRGVYGAGDEPDPRFSLANERTFLAWIRTTLALLAGAVGLRAFDLGISAGVERAASALLATAGLLAAIQAWTGWARTERAIRTAQPLPSNVVGIALVLAVAGAAAIVLGVSLSG